MLSVLLAVKNELAWIKLCLESVSKALANLEHEVIVVSAEAGETRDWLSREANIKLLTQETAENDFGAAMNLGFNAARGEEVLILHADVYLTAGTAERLSELMSAYPRTAMVGAKTTRSLSPSMKYAGADYNDLAEMIKFAESIRAEGNKAPQLTMYLDSVCVLVKKSAWSDVGGFTKNRAPRPFPEWDLCLRLLQKGYHLWQATDIYVHHASPSQSELSVKSATVHQGIALFADKWGFNPIYSANVNFNLLKNLDARQKDLAVLDVGCACGGNLMCIKGENPAAELFGIEHNPQAAKIASLFGEVAALDVMELNRPDWREKFSHIILGDVLEHLADPAKALATLKSCLRPEGLMLVSVPNILHYTCWQQWFEGEWRYADNGVMDRTHLRFFTRKSILRLLQETGFEPQTLISVTIATPATADPLLEQILKLGNGIEKVDLLTYQWQIVAKNNGSAKQGEDYAKL